MSHRTPHTALLFGSGRRALRGTQSLTYHWAPFLSCYTAHMARCGRPAAAAVPRGSESVCSSANAASFQLLEREGPIIIGAAL